MSQSVYQRGQALLEAVGAMAALLALAYAVSWIGRVQFRALEAGQAGRQAGFSLAQGHEAPDGRDGMRIQMQRARTIEPDTSGGARAALSREWLAFDAKLLETSAEILVAPAQGVAWFGDGVQPLVLRRMTVVATGDGRAESDQETQHRLAGSGVGWGRAADSSRAMARDLRGRIADIETAWGKRAPEDDWVRIWRDLVPTDRVQR